LFKKKIISSRNHLILFKKKISSHNDHNFFKKKIIPSRNHHNFFLNMSTSADMNFVTECVIADDFIFLRQLGFDFTQYDELHKIDFRRVNIQDSNGDTALHKCVELGFYETALLLLTLGADSYLKNARGVSPISFFDTFRRPLYKNEELIQSLLQRSVTKKGLSLDEKKVLEGLKQKTEPLCKAIKKVLDSPCVRVPYKYRWNHNMGRLMEFQGLQESSSAGYGWNHNMGRMTEVLDFSSPRYQ
jgi:hypothetical protein